MCKLSGKYYSCRNGSVLVLVLIVVSAMTIVAFGLAYQTRIEMRLTKSNSEAAILRNLAFSGLEACKAILSEKELTAERVVKVCRFYPAKDNLKLFEQLNRPLEEGVLILFWIKDENSFLDLNKSNSAVWENLPEFSREKRACILDWMDEDSDTNPDGAETDYYQGLEPGYICKNAPFASVKEMLLVKGMTREEYLGNILHEEIFNSDDVESVFYKNAAQRLRFIDTFTTFGQATVNINTVSGDILSILPGLDQQVANTIVAYRSGPDGIANTDDDKIFVNAGDILQVEGLDEVQKELLSQYCCFDSDMFRVFSLAKKGQQICFMMATIRALENRPEVICVERLI